MKRPSFVLPLSLSLVFLSGTLVGGMAHRFYATRAVSADSTPPKPETFRREYMQKMRTRLSLDDAQLASLERIMDDTGERFRLHREQEKTEARRIRESHGERVSQLLTAAQKEEYVKMRAEWERERKAREASKSKRGR